MNDQRREWMMALATKLIGVPYLWGGATVGGFDCSGFVIWLYQVFGILPSGDWTAQALSKKFLQRTTLKDARQGDPVFYGSGPEGVTHVMLYAGVLNGVPMVIGASGGTHTTTTVEEARRRGAMVKMKPARYRSDFLFACDMELWQVGEH